MPKYLIHCSLFGTFETVLFVVLAVVLRATTSTGMPKLRKDQLQAFQKASNGFDMRGCVPSLTTSAATTKLDGPLLSNEAAFWVGVGFAEWIKGQGNNNAAVTIGLGRDSRASGVLLTQWLAGGIEAAGGTAYDIGLATTPAMYLSCTCSGIDVPWPFSGAISVTASHLPEQWNGFKFFTPDTPSNIGEEGIAGIIESVGLAKYDEVVPQPSSSSRLRCPSFLPTYAKFLQSTVYELCRSSASTITDNRHKAGTVDGKNFADVGKNDGLAHPLPLKGLKIVVNAGNGAGGFLAQTLAELGADTSSSIHLEPDGTFPNHIANPEDKAAIKATADAVIRCQADLGVCVDTDADRVGLVEGFHDPVTDKFVAKLLNRNCLVALVAKVALRGAPAPATTTSTGGGGDGRAVVVTDSATSNGVTKFIDETLGGRHVRYKKGYRYVIEKGRSIEGCVAAVECSGHGAWRDNGWVDDGSYTAVKLIAELAIMRGAAATSTVVPRLSDLLLGLKEPEDSVELRFRAVGGPSVMVEVTNNALDMLKTIATQQSANRDLCNKNDLLTAVWRCEDVNYEGLRVNFDIRRRLPSLPLPPTPGSQPEASSRNNAEVEGDDYWSGWCMLRASLHEPILSMQIESDQPGGAAVVSKLLWEGGFHQLQEVLDLKPLKTLAEAAK